MKMNVVMTETSLEEGNYRKVDGKDDDQDMAKNISPDIEWSNLNMTAQKGTKKILSDCWGSVSCIICLLSELNHPYLHVGQIGYDLWFVGCIGCWKVIPVEHSVRPTDCRWRCGH